VIFSLSNFSSVAELESAVTAIIFALGSIFKIF